MLSNFKSVAKGTIIYGFANVSIKLLGVILIPIYTNYKYLSKEDFGVLGVIDITYQLAIVVFGLSLYQSFARWYFDPEHKSSQKSLHFTVVFINAIICLVSFVIVYYSSSSISRILFDTERHAKLIWIMFAGSSVNIISAVSMVLLRLQERAGKYAIISVAKLLVTLGFTIWFVVYQHASVLGIYKAILFGEIIGFALIFKDIVRNSVIRFNFPELFQMLIYGLPLLLGTVSSVLLNTFDRYALNYLTDLDTVGTYTLAYRISNSIKIIVITSIQLSLVPIQFKKMNDSDHKRFFAKSLNYSTFVVMLCALTLSLFSTEIVKTFSSNVSYWQAANLIPVLSLSMVFVIMKENVWIGMQITKSSILMGLLIALTAGINIGLNFLLISQFGVYGATFSTLFSQIILFVLFYYVVQKKYPVQYELRNLILLICCGVGLYFLSMFSTNWPVFPRVLFKIILLISLPVILIPLKFYEPVELQTIRKFFQAFINKLKP